MSAPSACRNPDFPCTSAKKLQTKQSGHIQHPHSNMLKRFDEEKPAQAAFVVVLNC